MYIEKGRSKRRKGFVEGKGFSRGESKISGVARELGVDFRGKVVLDIGSSTGGFTSFALKAGALKVIAVEKGARQMRAPLRLDPRVELHEKTDVFSFNLDGEKPELVMIDVSFLSIRKVLAYAKANLVGEETEFLAMVKPQFEARSEQLVNGIVKNERMRREILRGFEEWARTHGFVTLGKRDNALSGKYGNVERFYRLRIAN